MHIGPDYNIWQMYMQDEHHVLGVWTSNGDEKELIDDKKKGKWLKRSV